MNAVEFEQYVKENATNSIPERRKDSSRRKH